MEQEVKGNVTRVQRLLQTHGPATAYSYIQRSGLDAFPPSLVCHIRRQLWAAQVKRQLMPQWRRMALDFALN